MVAKAVRFSTDARERMIRGVDILANAAKVTLGPKGRNVLLDKSYGAPRTTKDGVTVAREIELEDRFGVPNWCARSPRRPMRCRRWDDHGNRPGPGDPARGSSGR
jgi:hypothetical protein